MPRIACLHIPDFRLQVALAAMGGEPTGGLALVDPDDGRRLIVAASPGARLDGVKRGMTSVAAASLAPELVIRPIDRAALAAVQEDLEASVRSLCPVFESAGDGVVYALFDGLETRYAEDGVGGFLDDLTDLAETLDLPARVGVASTRFAARCAAIMQGRLPAHGPAAVRVPPSGEPAFLAPLPIQLLPDALDLIETLGALGVRTLGAFADLPKDGVARRWGARGTALHRLARGEDRATLVPTPERSRFETRTHSDYPITRTEALRFFLKQPLEHLIGKLDGEGLAARALAWEFTIEGSEPLRRTTHAAAPSASLPLWTDLLAVGFEGLSLQGGVVAARLEAVGVGPRPASQERLTGPRAAPPGARSVTLAHLAAELGPDGFGAAHPRPHLWPEERQAVGPAPDDAPTSRRRQRSLTQQTELWVPDRCADGALPPALRRVLPAEPIDVETREGRLARFRHRGGWFRIDRAHGPWDISGQWWTGRGARARRTFQVEGPAGIARIHWERTAVSEGWFLGAWLD